MKTIKSINMHRFKKREIEYIIPIEFEIEERSFPRYRHTFKTDKWLDINQWEEIFSRIDRILSNIFNANDWTLAADRGKLSVNDLHCNYEICEKSCSLSKLENINYELDWIMKVNINKRSSSSSSSSAKENKSSPTVKLDDILSSDIEFTENSEKDSNVISILSDETDFSFCGVPDSKKIKRDNCPSASSSRTGSEQNPKINPEIPRPKRKVGEIKEDNFTQGNLNKWIRLSDGKKENEKNKEAVLSNNNSNKSSQERRKNATTRNAMDSLDAEQLKQMNEFNERSTFEYQSKEDRKRELENYQILKCEHVTNDEIKKVIFTMKDQIDAIFSNSRKQQLIINGKVIEPWLITGSNVVNDNQSLSILKEVENQREIHERGTHESKLHDFILPLVIIEIFKKTHNLNSSEAMDRIRTQEEKKALFNCYND